MNYSISEIADILGLKETNFHDSTISVLLTDSRSLTFPEESMFFAIKSNKNDGHKYIYPLYKKGVRNFIVTEIPSQSEMMEDANFLLVKDSLKALQQIAKHHRVLFDIPVIGITGSNGKTIVKEWLYQLLHDDKNIVRSPRSYNSQIGVPLSVWQLNKQANLGIFEAGISKPFEMDKIADIIKPTIGILTNLGDTHQENFDNFRQKADEKIQLFKGCDLIIYDGDDMLLSTAIEEACLGTREIAWSRKDKNRPIYISSIEKGDKTSIIKYVFLGLEGTIEIPFIEDASVENAIHCLAVMLYFGVERATIAKRMLKLEPVAMRLEVTEGKKDCLIINDSYNSDINSLDIALDFQMRRASADKKNTLILSDILQTGLLPKALYRKVADLCKRKKVDKIIGIGRDICENEAFFTMEKEFYLSTEKFIQSGSLEKINNESILLKGARRFHFEEISDRLELREHETILEVNLDSIIHNYNAYKEKLKPTTKMVCMVKAFGYGAGSYELAKTLQDAGCDFLAVAVADEGSELRKRGITTPIMVMNPEFSTFRTLFTHFLEPEVYSFRLLKALIKEAEKCMITNFPIHIKIDSGMHRLGFLPEEIDELTDLLSKQNAVIVRSVFSHLAGADEFIFDDFTKKQIDVFKECANKIEKASDHKIIKHILNSAGIERFTNEQLDMVRLGIGLYGMEASNVNMHLENISTLKTTILQIKTLEKGESIGYSRKSFLERTSRIAVIPIGYADGYDRRLGNGNMHVIINGQKCPTIGNICMDACMIDVTDINCKEGDQVIIFGKELPVSLISDRLNTIPYEIITSISSRVKRVYFHE
ncbi:MAG: bifunctional UDP-N-acetylmuramoyl-tripeptide:D-alanyl-D-alanine ligase/alanine racemase [Bacteroidales bacterium]|nr:bifunctional UDP-N-acetylmuramoyl-tripeptide:D-alanyl-D-alanine ligase/alanine racemase [Bacteroidales bacterium]